MLRNCTSVLWRLLGASFLAVLFISLNAAQLDKTPKAVILLHRAAIQARKKPCTQVQFKLERYVSKANEHEFDEGYLFLAGGRFCLKIQTGDEIRSNGQATWAIDYKKRTAKTFPPIDTVLAKIPNGIPPPWMLYIDTTGFSWQKQTDTTINRQKINRLRLWPQPANQVNYTQIDVGLANKQLHDFKVFMRNGDYYRIEILNYAFPKQLDDTLFAPNPKRVKIMDKE